MPEPACSAPIAPTLTMRPVPEAVRCAIAARDAFNAVSTFSAYIRCQVFGSPDLRWRVIDAGDARAPRQRGFRDHFAKRAQRTGHNDHFSIHNDLPARLAKICRTYVS